LLYKAEPDGFDRDPSADSEILSVDLQNYGTIFLTVLQRKLNPVGDLPEHSNKTSTQKKQIRNEKKRRQRETSSLIY
jgi:hypothetical protein